VHVQPVLARRVRHTSLGGNSQLELDPLGSQDGREPQQGELGAAGLSRLRDREYA
jgi:hypothetical protein